MRFQQSQQQIHQRGFAAAGRTGYSYAFIHRDSRIEIMKNLLPARIAETYITQFDLFFKGNRSRVLRIFRGERYKIIEQGVEYILGLANQGQIVIASAHRRSCG